MKKQDVPFFRSSEYHAGGERFYKDLKLVCPDAGHLSEASVVRLLTFKWCFLIRFQTGGTSRGLVASLAGACAAAFLDLCLSIRGFTCRGPGNGSWGIIAERVWNI